MKLLWQEDKVSFEGKHYTVKDAICMPKPYQKSIPILIGSNRANPNVVDLIADYADQVNFAWAFSPEDFVKNQNRIKNRCKEKGRDPESFYWTYGSWTSFYNSEQEKEEAIKEISKKRGIPEEEYRSRINKSLAGTNDEIINKIKNYEEIGVEHIIFMFPYNKEKEYIDRFSTQILPSL